MPKSDDPSKQPSVIYMPRRVAARRFESLYQEQLAIDAEDAFKAGEVGYICRALVQATLPYKEPKNDPPAWGRTNGKVSLVIQPGYYMQNEIQIVKGRQVQTTVPRSLGYPYGSIPRLLLAWIGREVKLKKQREIVLGRSLASFMAELGMQTATGGKNGSITRLREQMRRTFSAKIAILDNPNMQATDWLSDAFLLVDKSQIWWDNKVSNQQQPDLFDSRIVLSERFHDELASSPVPVDMRALKALKGSPSALDLYCFLTYRMFTLRHSLTIPWEALMMQFGSETASERKFRWQFRQAMAAVRLVYKDARADVTKAGLELKPSPTSITSNGGRSRIATF